MDELRQLDLPRWVSRLFLGFAALAGTGAGLGVAAGRPVAEVGFGLALAAGNLWVGLASKDKPKR